MESIQRGKNRRLVVLPGDAQPGVSALPVVPAIPATVMISLPPLRSGFVTHVVSETAMEHPRFNAQKFEYQMSVPHPLISASNSSSHSRRNPGLNLCVLPRRASGNARDGDEPGRRSAHGRVHLDHARPPRAPALGPPQLLRPRPAAG